MILLQNLSGGGYVHPFLGLLVPGQIQHRIQIVSQHRSLRRTEGLLFQPVHILQKLLFLLLG